MVDLIRLNTTRDFAVQFIEIPGNKPFDPINPTIEIVHYESGSQIFDLSPTVLIKVEVGNYVYHLNITSPPFVLDETYFVRYRGIHPTSGELILIEEEFRIVPEKALGGQTYSYSFY